MELDSVEASALVNHTDVFDGASGPQADVVDLGQTLSLSVDLVRIGGEVVGTNELRQTVFEQLQVEGVVEVAVVEPRHGVYVVVSAESINILLTRGGYGGMEGERSISGGGCHRHVVYF